MSKIALITGATSGIGEATAHELASKGINLIITGRREERLECVKREILSNYPTLKVIYLCFDVRDRATTAMAINSLEAEWRNINILVNNAGLASGLEHIDAGDFEDWDKMIDTNIKGVLNVTKVVSQLMIERGEGHIVNIGSTAGTQVYENGAVYCASKHAMHALSQGMRIDLLKHGIRVSEVRPGMVETAFSVVRFHGDQTRADGVYKGLEPLTPQNIAEIIGWIVTLPKHVNINDIEVTPQAQANSFYVNRK